MIEFIAGTTMRKPINVYLDTQDYVNLGKTELSTELNGVKSYIVDALESKSIVIGYSYPIVFELIRSSDAQHKADRQRRAKIIKEFCGSNAHPYPTDLSAGKRFPNSGVWVPMSTFDDFTPELIKSKLFAPIHNILADPRLTRAQRKQLKSTRGLREFLKTSKIGPFTKSDFGDVPVPEAMLQERIIERYLRGEVHASVVVSSLRRWMLDPENLMETWYEYSGLSNPLEAIISNTATPLFNALEKMKQLVIEYRAAVKSQKKSQRQLRKMIVKAGLDAQALGISELLAPAPQLEIDFPKKKFEEFFGVGRGDVIESYVNSIVFDKLDSEDSDLADMLHFLYIPDVDLFRCDKKMAHLVGRKASSYQRKIVSSLSDLPNRIELLKKSLG